MSKLNYINPFLESTQYVLSQMMQVGTSNGDILVKDVQCTENHIWIKIGITGQIEGDVLFDFHKEVALKIVSLLMGGFTFDQIDDMTKSAISEIGNMISGNATTIFFNQGIKLNITTPEVIENTIDLGYAGKQVASVKINIDNIGELDIHVLL